MLLNGRLPATFSQQLFDVAEAEAKPMVEPHGVTNNFRGKAVTLVAGLGSFHAAQFATGGLN